MPEIQIAFVQLCTALSAAIGKENVRYEVLQETCGSKHLIHQVADLASRQEFNIDGQYEEYEIRKAITKGAAYSIVMPFTLNSKIYFDCNGQVIGGLQCLDEYSTFITKEQEFGL
jgi:hypothetical protein